MCFPLVRRRFGFAELSKLSYNVCGASLAARRSRWLWPWWSSSAGIHSSSGCLGHCWLYMPLSTLFVVPPIERRRLWSGGQFKAPNELLTQLVCSFLNGFDYSAYFSPFSPLLSTVSIDMLLIKTLSQQVHSARWAGPHWSRVCEEAGPGVGAGEGHSIRAQDPIPSQPIHSESRCLPFDRLLMMMTIVSWC